MVVKRVGLLCCTVFSMPHQHIEPDTAITCHFDANDCLLFTVQQLEHRVLQWLRRRSFQIVEIRVDGSEIVKKLWRGESVTFEGPKGPVDVVTLPRPIQPELEVWVTTAGNPDTFRAAGEQGANILTHLLGQTVEQVGKNLEIYRAARKQAGHAGDGHVTMMLHTLVGEDEDTVRETAREPMKQYLKSAMFLVKSAAWQF